MARDLRLDLFRGLANWAIFLDHIPNNIVSWATTRNYGFSDAADIFVFISGYTASFVYARSMREGETLAASSRILQRAWQIYVAHVFILTVYLAAIAYSGAKTDNPEFARDFNVADFLHTPDIVLIQGLLLKFKPVNLDVLPLYILLMVSLPPVLYAVIRKANVTLCCSVIIYGLARTRGWNLPSYPKGEWYFNPFAWQLLFVFGSWCAVSGVDQFAWLIRSRRATLVAVAYLVFALFMTLAGHFQTLHQWVPAWLDKAVNPTDKTNLDLLRLLHFVALTLIVVHFVRADMEALKSLALRPVILCGQYSLEVFCLGLALSFASHFVLTEISKGPVMQILVSVGGIALMIALALLLTFYKRLDRAEAPGDHQPRVADQ